MSPQPPDVRHSAAKRGCRKTTGPGEAAKEGCQGDGGLETTSREGKGKGTKAVEPRGAGSGGPQSCLQASEGLSQGGGTELALWPPGVKPGPGSASHRGRFREG